MNRNCDSAFVEARFDPRRILKDFIEELTLIPNGVEARFDPRRILKAYDGAAVPLRSLVEARFDPRRILKVTRLTACGSGRMS